jgi:hypothetical protein
VSASRRRPDAVIEPSGNARAAATLSRSGVAGPTSSRNGIFELMCVTDNFLIVDVAVNDGRACYFTGFKNRHGLGSASTDPT